ncbi:post-GPI attachment to proteins factor 6 isoform X2 [Pristis pectinata]|uniref:post-GPI attachment to proteins factor 6 isoform X2 n=1 Tax=Pristis pectinata TaxID=685728 RepID=UPI00223E7E0A|nr:post-GPI attachment to proteins factor 6 isoform X2 [Pristis pectinata]
MVPQRGVCWFLGLLGLMLEDGWARLAGPTYVSEYYSQAPQKLSLYSWYGSARLFVFQVPENTVLMRWILQASKGKGPECQNINVTVHFRAGAPPVINPLQTKFGINTVALPSFNLTIPLSSDQTNTFLNISKPVPGDWFVAAHLPKDDGKIEVKGFSVKCSYIFQPQMFVQRLINVPVLEPNTSLRMTVSLLHPVAHLKIFIPENTAELAIQLTNCTINNHAVEACPVRLLIGSNSLPNSYLKILNCNESVNCRKILDSPPWMKWLQVTVESSNNDWIVSFDIEAYLTVCTPVDIGYLPTMNKNFTLSSKSSVTNNMDMFRVNMKINNTEAINDWKSCFHNQPVLREALDVDSVRFFVLNGPDVFVTSDYPIILLLNLNTRRDNGGTIILNLRLNKTSLSNENSTVFACLSAGSPVMSLDVNSMNCREALSWGYLLKMNASILSTSLHVPYPETDRWYLTLQILCPNDKGQVCVKESARVTVSTVLSPCIGDCGIYGECRLLRTHGYLYAACVCKAGWNGWSCTDDTHALSYGRQLLATLLLTLSNLMFIPPTVVAIHRYYFVEAAVYLFTMIFSTFYHACDQPGIAVLCIMEYDTLQYCDFLGSVLSVWVTVLCMAKLKSQFKYVLFILGSLLIAMSMQLDRRGLWNLLGPCLVALGIMVVAWVSQCVKRRHCYPPTWKRWVFFLLPGIGAALIAIAVYGFLETKENYYYTHSIWHILVAGSVVFLLPPGKKHISLWFWTRKLTCGYQICSNVEEDLYVVC